MIRYGMWTAILLVGCGASASDGSGDMGGGQASTGTSGSGGVGVGPGGDNVGSGGSGSPTGIGGSGQGGSGQGGTTGSTASGGAGVQADAGGGHAGSSSSDGGVWSPPTCVNGVASAGLPPNAPALKPGVWTDISPKGSNWAGEPGSGAFAQGMALDPCNPTTIYLTTEDFGVTPDVGVYKSTDAGATWNRISKLDEPIRVRVDPKDAKHLYAGDGVRGGTEGFFVSTDGGVTFAKPKGWTDLPAGPDKPFVDDVYDISVDPGDFNHVLVSSHSAYGWDTTKWNKNAGIVESKDGGNIWTVHDPVDGWGYGHGIWFLNNSTTWLLGTQGDGYWRTTDSGAHWTQVTKTNMAHGGGQIYYTKAGILYSASADEVMRSADNGATWTKVGTLKFTTSIYGDGKYLYAHQAYAGGAATFFTSPETDGMTWTPYNGGAQKFTDGPFEMAFDVANGILYSANWGNGILALKVQP